MEIGHGNWEEWEVFNQKHGNVFQSKAFAHSLTAGGSEVYLLTVRKSKKIIGGVVYFFPFSGIKKQFSELRVVSGPIAENKDVLNLLLQQLIQKAQQAQVIAIKIRGINQKLTYSKQFSIDTNAPSYAFNVQLTNEKDLWDKLDKKKRTAIKKAQKEGVEIKKGTEFTQLAYKLYLNRAKEKKGQIPLPFGYFKGLVEQKIAVPYIAYYQGRAIAESLFMFYGKTIYYFNNGSLREYKSLNANDLIMWEVMKNNKGKTLNLYGVSDGKDQQDKNYPIFKFKAGFGGELTEEFIYASKTISPKKKVMFDLLIKYALPIYKKLK